jgi:hypothetical protein
MVHEIQQMPAKLARMCFAQAVSLGRNPDRHVSKEQHEVHRGKQIHRKTVGNHSR